MSVHSEPRDGVTIIHLDDGKANAVNSATAAELSEALRAAQGPVVLAGREGSLSAGFDLKVMKAGGEAALDMVRAGFHLALDLYLHPTPVVAACTGHAIGAGAILLMAADVRVGAAGSFKIGLPEVKIGLPLPRVPQALARERLARARFVQATLCSSLLGPDAAVEVGFLDEVVAADEVLDRAVTRAAALGELPAAAFAATKRMQRQELVEAERSQIDADLAPFFAS